MGSYCRIVLAVILFAVGSGRLFAQEPSPAPSGDGEAAAAPALPAVRSTIPPGPEPEITPDVTPKSSPTAGTGTKTPAPTKTVIPSPIPQTMGTSSSGSSGGDSPGEAPPAALGSQPPAIDNGEQPATRPPAERDRTSKTMEILAWLPAVLGTLAIFVIVYLVASRPKNEHLSIVDRVAPDSGPPFAAHRRS